MIPNREMIASNPSIGKSYSTASATTHSRLAAADRSTGRVNHLGGDVDAADPPLGPDAVCCFDGCRTCSAADVEHALTGFQVDNGESRRGNRDQGCFHRRQMRQPESRSFGVPPIPLLNTGHGCACLPGHVRRQGFQRCLGPQHCRRSWRGRCRRSKSRHACRDYPAGGPWRLADPPHSSSADWTPGCQFGPAAATVSVCQVSVINSGTVGLCDQPGWPTPWSSSCGLPSSGA